MHVSYQRIPTPHQSERIDSVTQREKGVCAGSGTESVKPGALSTSVHAAEI